MSTDIFLLYFQLFIFNTKEKETVEGSQEMTIPMMTVLCIQMIILHIAHDVEVLGVKRMTPKLMIAGCISQRR